MFAGIARRYDLLNHLLSGNVDKSWRRFVARTLQPSLVEGARVLDVACGTGDLSRVLARAGAASVIGLDFCRPMLEIARRKAADDDRAVPFVEGDALRLPFADEAFDVVTIAFGLRNLAVVEEGLRELLRILKPGGRAAVLEFSSPVVPGFRALFRFYFTRLLPRIGGWGGGSRGGFSFLPPSPLGVPPHGRLGGVGGGGGVLRGGFL